jgi:hypothetical protein
MSDVSELKAAYDIYDPWIAANPERMPWILTLTSGSQVTLMIPLGAAVELEEKGFHVAAGVAPIEMAPVNHNPGEHWGEIFGD